MAKGHFKFDLKRFEPNDDLQCMFDFFNELWFNYELPYVRVGFYKHEKKHKEESKHKNWRIHRIIENPHPLEDELRMMEIAQKNKMLKHLP